MRTLVVAIAIFGMFATAAQAAADDSSPVVGQFPGTATTHVYLFMLKKNNISLQMSPQDFCTSLNYGKAVLGHQPPEIGEDNKVGPGKLEWVICRFESK